jgi:hypothetical protein
LLVGEVRLWLVVLDVLLYSMFGFCCDVHKLNHVLIPLELSDTLDWMVQAIKKTRHCSLVALFNVGADHVELYLLEILFHGLCPLDKRSKLVEEVTHVV